MNFGIIQQNIATGSLRVCDRWKNATSTLPFKGETIFLQMESMAYLCACVSSDVYVYLYIYILYNYVHMCEVCVCVCLNIVFISINKFCRSKLLQYPKSFYRYRRGRRYLALMTVSIFQTAHMQQSLAMSSNPWKSKATIFG